MTLSVSSDRARDRTLNARGLPGGCGASWSASDASTTSIFLASARVATMPSRFDSTQENNRFRSLWEKWAMPGPSTVARPRQNSA